MTSPPPGIPLLADQVELPGRPANRDPAPGRKLTTAQYKSTSVSIMTYLRPSALMALLAFFSGPLSAQAQSGADTVVLVSLDGFKSSYLEDYETPFLDSLITAGVHAPEGMIPVFPTSTFPNHYSMATGLYPQSHGIVSNTFFDPQIGEWFYISNKPAQSDPRWWGGEPLWTTVESAGRKAATFFWVGSEVEGTRASSWLPYDSVPFEVRIDSLQSWLSRPEDSIPALITLYFPEPDGHGHSFGPDSGEMAVKVREMDAWVGEIVKTIKQLGARRRIALIVVSDHGMAQQLGQGIYLSDYLSEQDVIRRVIGPYLDLTVPEGQESEVLQRLQGAHPALHVYSVDKAPDEWKVASHPRRGQIIGSADPGWYIRWDRSQAVYGGGAHGFDNRLTSMRALFVAHGAGIMSGAVLQAFDIIHVHRLVLDLLGIPAPESAQSRTTPFEPALSALHTPSAVISASSLGGPAPHVIEFQASASTDPDNDTLAFSWDFGDGGTGAGEVVSHTYSTAGTYRVSLTASDGVLTDTDSLQVSIASGVDTKSFELPATFILKAAYPNPFNPTTTVTYGLPVAAQVHITVSDLLGRTVKTLVAGELSAPGYYTVQFNAAGLASGTYLIKMEVGDFVATQQVVLMK